MLQAAGGFKMPSRDTVKETAEAGAKKAAAAVAAPVIDFQAELRHSSMPLVTRVINACLPLEHKA